MTYRRRHERPRRPPPRRAGGDEVPRGRAALRPPRRRVGAHARRAAPRRRSRTSSPRSRPSSSCSTGSPSTTRSPTLAAAHAERFGVRTPDIARRLRHRRDRRAPRRRAATVDVRTLPMFPRLPALRRRRCARRRERSPDAPLSRLRCAASGPSQLHADRDGRRSSHVAWSVELGELTARRRLTGRRTPATAVGRRAAPAARLRRSGSTSNGARARVVPSQTSRDARRRPAATTSTTAADSVRPLCGTPASCAAHATSSSPWRSTRPTRSARSRSCPRG